MSVELETEINVKEKIKEVIQDPGKYKVVFANDNETPMDVPFQEASADFYDDHGNYFVFYCLLRSLLASIENTNV